MAAVAATALAGLLSGCSGQDAAHTLSVLDADGYEYCAQATEDGSATFALSRVRNDGGEAVVGVRGVRLVDAPDGMEALGAYFSTAAGGPRSGAPFDSSTSGDSIAAGADAAVAIGVALREGASSAVSPGAVITYETADGSTGQVTTKVAIRIVAQGAAC